MTRAIRILSLLAAAFFSQGLLWVGCAPDPAAKVAAISRLRDNLYVVTGGGGNSAVLVTDAGVVVVDSKWDGWGHVLLEQIRTVTDKPVITVINTHPHGDHMGDNAFFSPAEIVMQEHAAHWIREGLRQSGGGPMPPVRTFADRLTLTKGRDRIELYYFGAGHTDGDTIVVFPDLGVAHTGDLFSAKGLPTIDAVHGGSGVAYPETVAKLFDAVKGVDTIITGHSPPQTWNDLGEFVAFNREFLAWTREQLAAGRSVEDAAAAYRVPAKYTGYPNQPWRAKPNIEAIYRELRPSSAHRWWGGVR